MEIKYSLNGSFGVVNNREQKQISITDDLLINLIFVLPNEYSKNDKYKITISNGTIKQQLSLDKLFFEVPKEFIFAGEIKIVVSHLLKGRVSKNWICESLYLVNENVDTINFIKIVPEVSALENRIIDCENNIEKFNKKLDLITKLVYSICEIEPKESKND